MNVFKIGSMFLTKDEFKSYLKYKIDFFFPPPNQESGTEVQI